MFADDHEQFAAFKFPSKHNYALVSCMDSLFLLRRNLLDLLTSETAKEKVCADKGASELGSLSDLTSNAILDGGAIVGLWEYDPASSAIAWTTFVEPDKALGDVVSRTEAFVRDQPKSRVPRIEAIRKASKR